MYPLQKTDRKQHHAWMFSLFGANTSINPKLLLLFLIILFLCLYAKFDFDSEATVSFSPSPLIVIRDSFSLWTWARVQSARIRSTAYFNGCPYIVLIYYYIYYIFLYDIFMTSPLWLAVGPPSLCGGLFTIFLMCVLLITRLLWLVGRLNSRTPV